MIVVAAMGRRPNSAYWIIIDGACEVDCQLEIFVRSINGSRCTALGIMTAPVDVVRLPRIDLPAVFRETEVNCDQQPLVLWLLAAQQIGREPREREQQR